MTAELKEYLSSLELRYGKAKKEEERTQLAFEITGILIAVKHMTEYASQQRTEGIREGFEAARVVKSHNIDGDKERLRYTCIME